MGKKYSDIYIFIAIGFSLFTSVKLPRVYIVVLMNCIPLNFGVKIIIYYVIFIFYGIHKSTYIIHANYFLDKMRVSANLAVCSFLFVIIHMTQVFYSILNV